MINDFEWPSTKRYRSQVRDYARAAIAFRRVSPIILLLLSSSLQRFGMKKIILKKLIRYRLFYKQFCKEFSKSCLWNVKKKEIQNMKPKSTISSASSSSSSAPISSTLSTSLRAPVSANNPVTKLNDQPVRAENIVPGSRVGSRERIKRILHDEIHTDAPPKKVSCLRIFYLHQLYCMKYWWKKRLIFVWNWTGFLLYFSLIFVVEKGLI